MTKFRYLNGNNRNVFERFVRQSNNYGAFY